MDIQQLQADIELKKQVYEQKTEAFKAVLDTGHANHNSALRRAGTEHYHAMLVYIEAYTQGLIMGLQLPEMFDDLDEED
jgi:hypothetical protein